jgi:SAM-dependent methyltransferase
MDQWEIKRLNEGEYDPSEYWEKRLDGLFTLRGVGHLGFSEAYNSWYYRSNGRVLAQALKKCSIRTSGSRLLDIGIGTGYYIDFWKKHGVRELVGLDITEKSVKELRSRYPGFNFYKADISEPLELDLGKFDVVTVFNVLFHVIGDEAFERAISSIASLLAEGGTLLVIDNFLAGDEPARGHHEEHRTLSRYDEALRHVGLEVCDMVPISFLMNTPVNAAAVSNPVARVLAVRGFRVNQLVAGVLRRLRKPGELLTHAWGFITYNLDRAALHLFAEAPGQRLAVIRAAGPSKR